MTRSFPRELMLLRNARSVGSRWRQFLQLLGALALVVAVDTALPSYPLKQFYLGAAFGGVVMVMALAIARFDEPRNLGYLCEQFSAENLKDIRGWTVVNSVPFDRFDIDHVVITPAGVLAVETKWHGRWTDESVRKDSVAAALEAARKTRSLLRSEHLHEAASVTPVLMAWGRGIEFPACGAREIDGVIVVDPEHPELWSHRYQAPLVNPDVRARLAAAFTAHSAKVYSRRETNNDSMKRRLWREFLDGVREERTERASRRAHIDSQRGRHARSKVTAGQ